MSGDLALAGSFLFAATVFGGFIYAVRKHNKNWNIKHPDTLESYLQKFPQARTGKGIACGYCGSLSLRNLGWQRANDTKRLVSCNSCSSNLYHAEN
jgi:DNA-directed RNA polymerase subunit RPC12/RpoP